MRAYRLSLDLMTAAVLSAALTGCMVGPDYKGPPQAAPLASQGGAFQRAMIAPVDGAPPPAQWWLALGDPQLTRLINDALADNPNLKAAQARVRNARAMLQEQRAGLLPQGGGSLAYIHAAIPKSADALLGGGAGGSSSGSGGVDLYSAAFDASWELDVFGGTRRGVQASRASAQAQQASFEDTQVELASEVAQAYVNLRDAQRRLILDTMVADLEDRMLQLTRTRRAGGTASEADVERLATQLSQTQADLAPLKASAEQALDQLAVLTGREPGALDADLAAPSDLPLPPPQVAIGDPAGLIRRRPDIRQAERLLAADTAAIGQKAASYFPSVNLFGTIGYSGADTAKLLSGDNLIQLGAPYLSWNVFNFPKINAQVKQAKATRDAAVFSYEQTVLTALQDAEDSLSRFARQRENAVQLAKARDSAARAAQLTQARYRDGTATLIDLLDTERQRLQTEQSLSQSQALLTNDYIALQKSLGLGWQGEPAPEGRGG